MNESVEKLHKADNARMEELESMQGGGVHARQLMGSRACSARRPPDLVKRLRCEPVQRHERYVVCGEVFLMKSKLNILLMALWK